MYVFPPGGGVGSFFCPCSVFPSLEVSWEQQQFCTQQGEHPPDNLTRSACTPKIARREDFLTEPLPYCYFSAKWVMKRFNLTGGFDSSPSLQGMWGEKTCLSWQPVSPGHTWSEVLKAVYHRRCLGMMRWAGDPSVSLSSPWFLIFPKVSWVLGWMQTERHVTKITSFLCFLHSLSCRRCIIVGNGGVLANKSLGSKIDDYDVVVRWVFGITVFLSFIQFQLACSAGKG